MPDEHTELAHVVDRFPDHRTLSRALQDAVNATMARLHAERGEVHTAEDVFATVRWMQGTAEKLRDYGRAFNEAAKLVEGYAEDELLDAVGDQDGVPMSGLTVPDADGDVTLTIDRANEYDIDRTAVFAAVAFDALPGGLPEDQETELAGLLIAAMERLTTLGKFDPQVSKVRAFAAELSRRREDKVAGTVTSAIKKTTVYKGVKLGRRAA